MLERDTATIPLAYGLTGGTDARAIRAPEFSICRNAQFEELGGLQERKPFASMSMSIVGGGTIANPRALAVNGDELLLFTKSSLYTWSERENAWVLRSAHPAPAVEETAAFATTRDQVIADRAELDGVAIYVWIEQPSSGNPPLYIAAVDVETGAVLHPPTLIKTSSQPAIRAVAMASQILVIWNNGTGPLAEGFAVNPATVSANITSGISSPTSFTTASTTGRMDVVYDPSSGNVYAAFDRGASYTVARIPANLAETVQSYARAAGPIAIAVEQNSNILTVVRRNATPTIRADQINKTTLADVNPDVNLGAPSNSSVANITAECRPFVPSLPGGVEVTYAFWSSGESSSGAISTFTCESNFITSAGTIGTSVIIARRLGVASRAFHWDGKIYVWLMFAGESEASGMAVQTSLPAQLQNVYLLFSESDTSNASEPLAKAVTDRAGGFYVFGGRLPGVQQTSTGVFQWAGIERRIVPLNDKQSNYTARTPRIIRTAFDSIGGRRTARLGRTLYVAGGQIHQYDGVSLVELGFHVAPYAWTTVSLGGSLAAGSYNHIGTYSWVNAVQERERSTIVCASATVVGAAQLIEFSGSVTPFLYATRKKNTRAAPAVEYWRQAVNASPEAPFHLVTGIDVTNLTNPNRFISNDPATAFVPTFQDDLVDADLALTEGYGENGNQLQSFPPVPASIVIATQDRLILAGLADDPYGFAYSQLRADGALAAFNGQLRGSLPPEGGRVTAAAVMTETLVLFEERAIFALPGDGFDNLGGGQNYGPARRISSGVGAVSQETVAVTPRGVLFKSLRGWYLLTGWQEPVYVGQAVSDFDDEEVVGIAVIENQHQVRIVTTERILTWDYEAYKERGGAWSEWTSSLIADCLSTVVWQGQHVVLTATGCLRQAEFGAPGVTETVELDVELGWLVTGEWQAIWALLVEGEYRGASRLRVRLKRNKKDSTVFQDKTYTPTVDQAVVGETVVFRHAPSILQHDSLKIRLTTRHASNDAPPAGAAMSLTAIKFDYGVEKRLRGLAPANSQ